MIKKSCLIFIFCCLAFSCSSSKNIVKSNSKADKIVVKALQYKGVRYKFGGTTKKGMDCSGIVFVAYKSENITLPRVSRNMAKKGKKTPLKNVKKGDLVFFRTNKNSRRINHVGLVISHKNNQIQFIHATSSKGVIVSNMNQKYWKKAFVKAQKIL